MKCYLTLRINKSFYSKNWIYICK